MGAQPEPDELSEMFLGGPRHLTGDEVAQLVGIDRAEADALWQAMGFPHLGQDVAFADGDVSALRRARELMDAGLIGPDLQLALTRLLGRTMARLAETQVALAYEAAQRGTTTDPAELTGLMRELQDYVWRRHLLAASERLAAREPEDGVAVAVGFTDLVSYTARSREMSTDDLAAMLETFEARAQEAVVDGGGRIIKSLGDEVMWVVDAPRPAVDIALALAGPEVRTGVAYGPTLVRAGDHYGPTVNLAARLTGLARPGSVLVDHQLSGRIEDDPDLSLRHLRPVKVRGYDHLRSTAVTHRGGPPRAA